MRFTACDDDVSMMNTQTKKNAPSAIPVGRRKDRLVEIPVSSFVMTTKTANPTDTTAVPRNFCHLFSPSDRRRRTFVKSSRKPTRPKPTAANTSARPVAVNRWAERRDAR